MRIIVPLVKLGLGGGAVYLITNEGLFSASQKDTIEASKKIADSVPGLNPYLEKIPKVMTKDEMINYWNSEINVLQSEMLKFHDKISPVKNQESASDLPFHKGNSKFTPSFTDLAFGFLKICICVFGPVTFPAIVFCIEGASLLFWQVTAASCAITLLLAIMSLTILHANLKELKQRTRDTFMLLRRLFNNLKIYLFERTAVVSDIVKENTDVISYFLYIILICNSITYLSYSYDFITTFYGSLISTGFVYGVFMSLFYNLLNTSSVSPELPTYNTSRVELHVTAPSPELQNVKRYPDLNCYKSRKPNYEFRIPQPNSILISGRFTESAGIGTTEAVLPYIRATTFQNAARTGTLQLPFDFGKLLRRLSF